MARPFDLELGAMINYCQAEIRNFSHRYDGKYSR
jgi:hypothetical protein